MKRLCYVLMLIVLSVPCTAQSINLSKYVWKKTATTYDRRVSGVDNQGGAYYDGKYYQFYDKTGGIKIFDVKTMKEIGSMPMTADGSLHFGSVSFCNEFSYVKNGETVNTTLPLIYATGHYDAGSGKKEIVDVIDIENNTLVRQYEFPERRDDVIAAWDFEGKRFWIIGYEPVNGYAETPYYINEYKWNEDGTYSEVGEAAVVNITMSTLQDCYYKDGHIYILAGWGKNSQKVQIHDYNTTTKTLDNTSTVDNGDEAEGFAYVPETNSFIVTTWTRGGSKAYYWHVALPGTEPYYTTLAAEGNAYDRYNVDAQKNYELYTLSLDDMADGMGLPDDAASVTAAKINYQRSGVSGVNSVCMPFALKPEMVDGGIYTVSAANEVSVTLTKQPEGIAAGAPCFVKSDSNWDISLDCMPDNGGELYNIPLAPVTPDESATVKLFGSFETREIGAGFYKINSDGTALVRTTETSKTFPYRAYLELLGSTAAKISFTEEGVDAIKSVAAENTAVTVYNLSGQRVKANAKGIVIINGRKVIR